MSKKLKTLDDILDEVNRSVVSKNVYPEWKWGNAKLEPFVPLENVQELYDYARFSSAKIKNTRTEAIEKGYARYNAKTGEFEWI
jgi:hypothetical protein